MGIRLVKHNQTAYEAAVIIHGRIHFSSLSRPMKNNDHMGKCENGNKSKLIAKKCRYGKSKPIAERHWYGNEGESPAGTDGVKRDV